MKAIKRRPGWFLGAILLILVALPLAACSPSTPVPAATPSPAATDTAAPLPDPSDTGINPAGPDSPTATPIVVNLEGAETTDSGLQYLEETAGEGEQPKQGEVITMHYIATLPDGTELFNTYTQGGPVTTVWGADRLFPGWEEGVGLMNVGDKAKLVIPPSQAFGDQGSGAVPPNTQVVMEIELLSSEPAPVPAEVAADEMTTTESGLQYYDLEVGEGDEAVKNSSVSTNYTLWVKTDDGYSYIDSSINSTPVDFVLGRMDVVFPGWDEGVTGMNVGGKRQVIVPPDLGMGSQVSSLIPANSTLVMEIELLEATAPRTTSEVDEADYTTTESGLKYYDLVPGTGETPEAGQTVVVHYTGWLEDGTQFDSSLDRGQPFSFQLGAGNVIPGWDEGVSTMKVGGKRQIVVPPDLGYGDQGAGAVIPPGATLIFEVELIEVQ